MQTLPVPGRRRWAGVITALLLCTGWAVQVHAEGRARGAITYASPQQALAALRAQPSISERQENDWIVLYDPAGPVFWSVTTPANGWHPSIVRRELVAEDGQVAMQMSVKCGVSTPDCDALAQSFQASNERLRQRADVQTQAAQSLAAEDASDEPTAAEIGENARIREAIFSGEAGGLKLADYPVAKVYRGPAAALDMSTREARMFKTRMSAALKDGKVEFAGEYTVAGWGCGTSCFSQTFISLRTGKPLPQSLGGELGPNIVRIDPHSALVVAEGSEYDSNYDRTGHYAYFYVLEGHTLKLLRKVAVPETLGED